METIRLFVVHARYATWCLLLGLSVVLPMRLQAQFTYTTNSGAITLTGYTGTNSIVTLPDRLSGLPVTSIGDLAFQLNTNLVNVTIPGSITNIGMAAFDYCPSLTNVAIPNGVLSLGDNAFSFCFSLTEVVIPQSVMYIGAGSFSFCWNLISISVDSNNADYCSVEGVLFDRSQSILLAFPPAKDTAAYTVPATVTNIGDYAFADCSKLMSIGLPEDVSSIGNWAFEGCYALPGITLPASLSWVGQGAFEGCMGLTNVLLPEAVTELGDWAFGYCSRLREITLPRNLAHLGRAVFSGCSQLRAILVNTNNEVFGSKDGVLFDQSGTTLVAYPAGKAETYAIPQGVTNIGDYAFYDCSELANVALPAGVLRIGELAFADCYSLNHLALPGSVTEIANWAFSGCGTLPNLTLPASVTNIGLGVVSYCDRLQAINVDSHNPAYTAMDGVLFDHDQRRLVEYPPGKNGSAYAVPTGVTQIGDWAFYSCSGLSDLTLPEGLLSIGNCSFCSSSLVSLTIPSGVTNLGYESFGLCDRLRSVTLLATLTNLGWWTFYGCPSLVCVVCLGDAPGFDDALFDGPLSSKTSASVYYLPGTAGWGPTLDGQPTRLWNPQIQQPSGPFDGRTNPFGFSITGTSDLVVDVEACTNLAHPAWSPAGSVTLTNGAAFFSDPASTNSSHRFYRLRSP